MQATISNPTYHLTATEILWGLMKREEASWALMSTDSSMYQTNPDALHYVIDLNEFRMREIDNVVVFGLRDLGTVDQQRANYDNQGLTADQQRTQNVAITQLGMARVIRDYIRARFRNNAAVNLYVCDQGFTESIKGTLQELQFTVFGRDELSRHINQNTLVYDVTMHAGELQGAISLSWGENAVPPAAVITHMNSLSPNGAFDVGLLGNYWLAPLLDSAPSLIVSPEKFQAMRSGPGPRLPYNKWVYLQERHSQAVQRGYFEEAAAHSRVMARYQEYVAQVARCDGGIPDAPPPIPRKSWVSDPMMIILCRKDHPRPPVIVQDPQQQHGPLPRQQQPEYQLRVENWSEDEDVFEDSDEFEAADGHGGSSDVSYASMHRPYGYSGFSSHDGGSGQYLNVPHNGLRHRAWP